MGIFVSGRVAITATGVTDEKDITPATDVIFVRRKMDYGTRQRVVGAAVKITEKDVKRGRAARKARKAKQEAEFNVGAYQIALLVHNILEWRGPQFLGVPLLPRNIEQVDPDDPIIKAVLDYIGEANATEADDDADTDDDEVEEAGDDDPNVIEGEVVGLIRT